MKKSILNLGKALNKAEQKNVSGGFNLTSHDSCSGPNIGFPGKKCPPGAICVGGKCRHVVL